MKQFKFNTEDEVKCRFTGFAGIVMARTEWNNGCIRYSLQQKMGKDGKLPDLQVFDEQDLTLVKAGAKTLAERKNEKPAPLRGGPSRQDPSRSFGRV